MRTFLDSDAHRSFKADELIGSGVRNDFDRDHKIMSYLGSAINVPEDRGCSYPTLGLPLQISGALTGIEGDASATGSWHGRHSLQPWANHNARRNRAGSFTLVEASKISPGN